MYILGGGGWWNQLSTFDAEFKFAKIQNSYFGGGGGVVGGNQFPNFLKFNFNCSTLFKIVMNCNLHSPGAMYYKPTTFS